MSKYTEFIDQLPIPAQTAASIQSRAQHYRLKPTRILAAALTCVVMCIGLTALASKAITGEWLGLIVDIVGHEESVAGMREINETRTDGDYEITLKSAIGDMQSLYLLFDVRNTKGQPVFKTNDYFLPGMVDIFLDSDLYDADQETLGYGGSFTRIDDQSNPDRAQVVVEVHYESEGIAPPAQATMVIYSIRRGEVDRSDETPIVVAPILAEGEWAFTVPLDYEIDIVRYEFDDQITVDVSPISISVASDGVGPWTVTGVEMKDGGVIGLVDIGSRGGSSSSSEDFTVISWRSFVMFDSIINPRDAVALKTSQGRVELSGGRP